ncbi:MAG: hypothetical protein ACP5QZ_01560 [Candidatus Sumerlaeaceae bacterium]
MMNEQPANTTQGVWIRTTLVCLALWLTFIYVRHDEIGWNAKSRLCLTYALVDEATVRVDHFWQRPELSTRDIATVDGHYYSDKIIGTSLLGVPALAAVRLVERLQNRPFPPPVRHWLVAAGSVALLGAAAGGMFYRLAARYLREIGLGLRQTELLAFVATVGTFCGTMLLLYSGVVMPYLPAIFFLLLALFLLERADSGEPRTRLTGARSFAIGLSLGLAILCEYLAAWPAVLLLCYFAMVTRHWRKCLIAGIGLLGGITPFALYCFAIFGRFTIPYEYELETFFRQSMSRGLMGATLPKLSVAYLLAFHPYRGLFFYSPHLLLAVLGVIVSWRRGSRWRQRSLVFVGAFLGIFLYNAGYYLWWGGWGLAPRFLAVGVPFLALLSVPALSSLAARVIYVLAGSWGVCAYVVMNFMPHDFPERPHGAPLESLLFPDFAHFEYPNLFARYVCPKFLLGETDWSLATALGLSGLSALIPLAIVWLGIYAAFIVSLPRAPLTAAE